MNRLSEWTHLALGATVRPGDVVVDATLGNGHDARLLAELVGPTGEIHAFDVQEAALVESRKRLAGLDQVQLHLADHAELDQHLPAQHLGRVRAFVFNLGFLPGAPRERATKATSTLAALEHALHWAAPEGVIACTCYPGHEGGHEEAERVAAWFDACGEDGAQLTRIERRATLSAAPFVLWLERRPDDRIRTPR